MSRILAIGAAAEALQGAGIAHTRWEGDGPDLGGADVVVLPPDWERLRAWRVAGHTTPAVVVLDGAAKPEERAPLEPLTIVSGASPAELRAAIDAMRTSRRAGMLPLTVGTIDLATRTLATADGDVRLSRLETDLLAYLGAREGQDVSRDELLVQVWGHARAASGTRAVDMAMTRLRKKVERDPSAPEHLLTSRGDGYRLQLSSARRTNVGPSPNRFFGREDLLARITDALDGGRLATLLGAPGAGKTRLAQELARVAPERFAEVWFCDLVPARDRAGVCLAVSAAAGIELQDTEDPVERLGQVLATRPGMLLLLDNGEHLEVLGDLVSAWLGAAPALSVVVTSQRRLQVVNEALVPVVPLGPQEARALFLERAHAIGGVPAPQDRIDPLLERLDRLPLAIELAAARTRSLRVDQLEAYLDRRLEWLRRAPYDPDPRHESLWRALAWSWEALDDPLREVLTGLAVFRGGFGGETAAAVLDRDLVDVSMVLEDLQDRSLVQRDGTRFRLLESVRMFVEAHGPVEVRRRAETAHVACFAALARTGHPRLGGPDALTALAQLSEEAGNLAAALPRALGCDAKAAADLALGLDGLYRFRGAREERLRTLTSARDALDASDGDLGAELDYALGMLELRSRPDRAREHFHASGAHWRRTDPRRASLCETHIAYTLVIQGRAREAIAVLDEMRRSDGPHPLGECLWIYQQILHGTPPEDPLAEMRGRIETLVARGELALAASAVALAAQASQNLGLTTWTKTFADRLEWLLERVPEKRMLPVLTMIRATDLAQRSQHEAAVRTFESGLEDARVHANANALETILQRYAITAIHAGRHHVAEPLLREYLERVSDPFRRAFAFGALGSSAVDQGTLGEARRNLTELDCCLAERTSPTLQRARAQLAAQIEATAGNHRAAADLLQSATSEGISTGQHANRAGLSAVLGDRLGDGPLFRAAFADLQRVLDGGETPGFDNWRTLADALASREADPLRESLAYDSWHTGPRIAARVWLA